MKLTGKKIKSMLLCMMLTMAMAITAVGCGSKTGMLPDNELGKLRDNWSKKSNTWQVNIIADLLDILIDKFLENKNINK